MTPQRRTQLLIVTLVATLAAVAWVNGNEDDIAAPTQREHSGDSRPAPGAAKADKGMPELTLAELDARGLDDMKTDLFEAKSWYVAPPPPPPPKPTAPPPPFTVLGRMIQGGRTAVFVSYGGRNQVFGVGDVVDSDWRVDAIDATQVKLTYLPLNEEKSLALGAEP